MHSRLQASYSIALNIRGVKPSGWQDLCLFVFIMASHNVCSLKHNSVRSSELHRILTAAEVKTVALQKTFNFTNDVNSQQDATTFSFINLFKSAQHVSGDKFAHPQEHFSTVYTDFGTMHRSAAVSVHCTKGCTYSQKVLLRMGEFVARNM